MIDKETASAVRDAVKRILDGRETVPGDLPYPEAVNTYALAAAWPDEDPTRKYVTREGLRLAKATRQVYIAGFQAGRECDKQIGDQLRSWFGDGEHPYVGVAACLVCDQPPH